MIFLWFTIFIKNSTLYPTFIIKSCGDILINIREHFHINNEGIISATVMLVFALSGIFSLLQIFFFTIRYHKLGKHNKKFRKIPSHKLRGIFKKHNIDIQYLSLTERKNIIAYTTGFLHPRITVSNHFAENATLEQLEAVVLHELYHLRQHHLQFLLYIRITTATLFFLPFIRHFGQRLKTEFELAADSFVIKTQGTGENLRSTLALNLNYENNSVVPFFATTPLELRIDALLGKRIRHKSIGHVQFLISFCSLFILFFLALGLPNRIFAYNIQSLPNMCKKTDCTTNCINEYEIPASVRIHKS